MNWTVTIECASPAGTRGGFPSTDEQIDTFLDALDEHSGVVTTTPEESDRDEYGATLAIDDVSDPALAAESAQRVFRLAAEKAGMPELPIVRVEIVTWDEQARELARPDRQLIGVSEIGDLLGVTRQRAHTLTGSAGFPSPVAHLASGPVWEIRDVDAFRQTWERRPGRPRKVTADA